MAKLLVAALILILAVVGVFYISSTRNTAPKPTSVSQKVTIPTKNEVSQVPTLDTSDVSLDEDLTALDKDLADLNNSETTFANESQGL